MTGDDSGPLAKKLKLRLRLLLLILVLLGLLALASAWSWSPLRQWLDAARIVAAVEQMGLSVGPLAAILGIALALALAVPLTVLTWVAIVAFGATAGFFYTIAGAMLAAMISFGIGVMLGREVLQQLGGERINQISRRLAQRGVLSVIAIRIVPIAPFAIINMIAGATHLRLRDLLLGTAIGMMPGVMGIILFTGQIAEVLKNPNPLTWAIAMGTLALIAAGLWGVRRWLRAHEGTQESVPKSHR